MLLNTLNPGDYHLDDVDEILSTCFELLWVQICPLDGGEEELNWCNVVAMGSNQHERDPHLLEGIEGRRRLMIFGAVCHNKTVPPPIWISFVESLHELLKI